MIDWSRAPGWAKYAAIDKDGIVWFYSHLPHPVIGIGGWRSGGFCQVQEYQKWQNSLQIRDGEK